MKRFSLLVAALSVTALFAALGMWQLDRAAQKRDMSAEFERRGNTVEVDLNIVTVVLTLRNGANR